MTKLEKMLKYVSEHNEFYKNRIKEYGIKDPLDITQWPVLTREELQENRYNMFSDGYKTKFFSQLLKRQFSSGTSGVPINVYWDYNDYNRSLIPLWRKRMEYYGIKPSHRLVKFSYYVYNTEFSDKNILYYMESPNVLVVNRSCLQNELKYKELIDLINTFSPKWLYVQPFILNKLLYYYKTFNLKPPTSLTYIESVGEILSLKLRKEAEQFFDVFLANMYGSEEMNGIAYECPNHKMHIIDDNVFLELNKCPGLVLDSEGEIIITNLNNHAMPLIRYNQADIVNIIKPNICCKCGNQSSQIDIIKGRVSGSLDRKGVNINSYLLIEIIDEVNNSLKDIILEFRFVYIATEDVMRCFLQLQDERLMWRNIVEKSILMGFIKKGIKDLRLEFDYLNNDLCKKNLKNVILSIER